MAQRAQRSLEAAKKAVPEGTFAVGTGLAVTGLTTYGFFVAAARGLSSTDYAAVIGRFHLDRSQEAGGESSGIFTLLFHRTAQGWKVILDHTS